MTRLTRHTWLLMPALAASLCSACSGGTEREHEVIPSEAGPMGKLTAVVAEGERWLHPFNINVLVKGSSLPQLALWLEDEDGKFVSTIYVTQRTATQNWRAFPGETREEIVRPYSLPVWVGKHREVGIAPMSSCRACHSKHTAEDRSYEGDPILEAVTGASPRWGFTMEWPVPAEIKPGTYTVRLEVNQSMDFNEVYAEELPREDPNYSGGRLGSGQPSVVWEGVIAIGDEAASGSLAAVGHGHPGGKGGGVDADLSAITSAVGIIESIQVSYSPPGMTDETTAE